MSHTIGNGFALSRQAIEVLRNEHKRVNKRFEMTRSLHGSGSREADAALSELFEVERIMSLLHIDYD